MKFVFISEIYIYPTYTLGSGANSFSNDYLTQVKPISIHLLLRVGDKGTTRVTFQQFLVAGALSALDVIDSVWVGVCVCMCVRGASICNKTVKVGALQCHKLRWCILASELLLSLKAVREAVWAFGSLTPLENCIQIKILKPLRRRRACGVYTICFDVKLG